MSSNTDSLGIAEEFFRTIQWPARREGSRLHVTPLGTNDVRVRELIIARGDDGESVHGADILLFRDANSVPPDGGWSDLADCAAAAAADNHGRGPIHVRIGRDIIFAAYFRRLSTIHREAGRGAPVAEPTLWLASPSAASLEQRPLAEIAEAAMKGECALIALPGGEGLDGIVGGLFDIHTKAIAGAAAQDALRIPLLIDSAEIRVGGLRQTIARVARELTGTAMTDLLVDQLVSLGFFHLYVGEAERLRDGDVLDPNAMFMADVIASGSFTLGCDREHVFHGPLFDLVPGGEDGAPPLDPLRTVGERFYWDSKLELYDGGRGNPARRVGAKAMRAELDELTEEIAQRSEGRLTRYEAAALLRTLALEHQQTEAGSIALTTIVSRLRARLSGDRVRPANLRLALAALLGSPALRAFAPEIYTFRSTAFAHWLLAEAVAEAAAAFLHYDDTAPLAGVLDRQRVPLWIMRWALSIDDSGAANALASASGLAVLLQELRFGEENTSPVKALLMTNLWTLTLAVACDGVDEKGRSGPDKLRELSGQVVTLNSAGLSQACFAGLNLNGWRFLDCDLSHALFLRCDVRSTIFAESSLAGCRFEECRFHSVTRFKGADVSGALFLRPAGFDQFSRGRDVSERLDRSNWSATAIIGVDDSGGGENHLAPFRAANVSAAAMRYGDHEAISWPPTVLQAFLRGWWGESPLLSRRDGLFFRLREFARRYPLPNGSGTSPAFRSVKQLGATVETQRFVGIDDRHDLWTGRCEGESIAWLAVGQVPEGTDLSIIEGGVADEGRLMIAVLAPARDLLSIGALNGGLTIEPLALPFAVHATRWFQPSRWGDPSPELAIAHQGGGASLAYRDEQTGAWRLGEPIPALAEIAVEAFGYSPRENLLVACGTGGEVVGLRHIEPGVVQPMFRFNTALRLVLGVVLLNQLGQLLIVGGGQVDPGARPEERDLLWVLIGASGRVVSVVRQEPGTIFADTSGECVALPEDASEGDFSAAQNRAAAIAGTRRRIQATLDGLVQERTILPVTPRLTNTVDFVLSDSVSRGGKEDGVFLPESFEDEFGPRFRTLELSIEDGAAGGRPRHYLETDLQLADFEGRRVKARVAPMFKDGAAHASATLSVGYSSSEGEKPLVRPFHFDLQIEWEDNPFVSDGTPVTGKQFFGFEKLIARVKNALLVPEHVIVMSRRRAGKSSLIAQVAQQLREESLVVAVTISGEDVVLRDHRIDRAVQEGLRLIGATGGGRYYNELGGMRLKRSDSIVEMLIQLVSGASKSGFKPPFVLFIDEWGYLKDKEIGKILVNSAATLKDNGIALCLTSVPGDFPIAAENYQSGDYRFFGSHTLELGPMDEAALTMLVTEPLKDRRFKIDPEALQLILRYSSGVPHDANILMHSAFRAAKAEVDRSGSTKSRVIEVRHVLGEDVPPEDSPIRNLREKYAAQRETLLGKLDSAEQQRILEIADQILTGYERPDRSPAPFLVPAIETPGRRERNALANAGYRISAVLGEKAEGSSLAKLWLPWGLAYYLKSIRDEGEAA